MHNEINFVRFADERTVIDWPPSWSRSVYTVKLIPTNYWLSFSINSKQKLQKVLRSE